MIEFTVRIANRPGKLAMLAEQIAESGVNIEALAAYSAGSDAYARMMVDNDQVARKVLTDAGLDYEERRVILTLLPDRPGSLALMAHNLAVADVNIDAMYLVHRSAEGLQFAMAVNDPDRAEQQLDRE